MTKSCFHCNEPIPHGLELSVNINESSQPMCCIGCQAVAQTIVDNGLVDYYKFRTEPANKGEILVPDQLSKHKLLDDDALQNEFIHQDGDTKESILTVDNISCAACAWLIEMKISQLTGVKQITVNATTQRATVKWLDEEIKLSEILAAIDAIGYHALPFKASIAEELNQQQSKSFIKRLGISGILMMQVMMIAIGLYFGAFSDMSSHNENYLRWASMILSFPIISYGAYPFYTGAINALKVRRLSMDVPVSIAITLAYTASAWATVTRQGEVYFESVSMFTFLLLIGKFLEFRARNRAAQVSANLLKLMPLSATIIEDGHPKLIAAKKLQLQDSVLIKPGETIPADGLISHGQSQVNEAMLSGEQKPVSKIQGDKVFAGTINGDGNITISVTSLMSDSFLSQLIRLSESAQSHKPQLAKFSDRIAQYFVALILVMASITALYWSQHMPEEAFWITLSVLVATCPCALSLATPTALTCATTKLNRSGIMIKSAHVMETMPQIDLYAFDKTGTLTTGQFTIDHVELYDAPVTKKELLTYIASAEAYSEHPIAQAFHPYFDSNTRINDVEIIAGCGVKAIINNQTLVVGKSKWILEQIASSEGISTFVKNAACVVLLDNKLIAAIQLKDTIREDAQPLLARIKKQGGKTLLLSGDNEEGCRQVKEKLPIDEVHSQLSAKDKMSKLKAAQQNHNVVMVGDGINDTPVFSAAHLSIAMGSGADIAKNGADVILLNNKLDSMTTLLNVSVKTKRIIRQNYAWAFGYNAIVLPLAMSGYITPYFAVIGMSASSILVVTNSLRLLK